MPRPEAASRLRISEHSPRPESSEILNLPGEAFLEVAELIKREPPEWLTQHLQSWAYSIQLAAAVDRRQPGRADVRKALNAVIESSSLLARALEQQALIEFLNSGQNAPLPKQDLLNALADLQQRATVAANSEALANSLGKTRAGPGRAMPTEALPARTFCALLIAETWKFLNGRMPGLDNPKAADAAEAYWRLIGQERRARGEDPASAWPRHFEGARSARYEKHRKEVQRHLREAKRSAAALDEDNGQGA